MIIFINNLFCKIILAAAHSLQNIYSKTVINKYFIKLAAHILSLICIGE